MPITNERIVWIDCEMTGLDSVNDALIEVAALVTDSELNILGDGVDVVIKPDDAALAQMNDFVRDMHTRSGLLKELPTAKPWPRPRPQCSSTSASGYRTPARRPLAGNSVGTDRVFLARDMPSVVEHLHYRIIDVSTIKELSRRWFARAYFQAPAKHGGHRALGDIKDSIDELRYYREAVFVPAPGPDSATAQKISKRISGAGRNRRSVRPRRAFAGGRGGARKVICATFGGNFAEKSQKWQNHP